MDNDAITFTQPTGPRPTDRRAVLWDELDRLHAQLGIEPPTATYSLEALEAEVVLARRAGASIPNVADRLSVDAAVQQQAGAALEDTFGERILDAQQAARQRRTHKTWRSFYGPLLLNERSTPEPYEGTPREDGAGTGEAHVESSSAHSRLATQDANAS